MPLGRFFGRGKDEPPPDVEEEAEEQAEEAPPDDAERVDWRARAANVLPTGASAGSKRPAALYGDDAADGPTHFVQSVGCRVIDVHGNTYIDCGMALGAVALGYAEPNVTRAVIDAAAHGTVSGLSSVLEVEVAERLCAAIPCAEKVQFLKTGAEAMAAGVRIARTYTGRDVVIGCGYFGWLDWSATAAGVPAGTRGDYRAVPYDDVQALETTARATGGSLAAIVLEPVIERLPSEAWIAKARELCDALGAVLIFDEIKTGFRLHTGGYHGYAKVKPDLAAFGKAMANGYPLSAIVGRRDVMDAARNSWISSTLAGETTALAAAGAVLDWHEQADICESLWKTGAELRRVVSDAIAASGMEGVTIDGIDPMFLIRFDDPKRETLFLERGAANGVLFKRGAYNYAAVAHDEDAIHDVEEGASAAFVEVLEAESHR
jgi:glutamate-1-semialdehyde 2,1-aminomutase